VRVTATQRTIILLAVLTAAPFGIVDTQPLGVGIAPAAAKEVYTRKRVRGRWITGHFTRKHSAQHRRGAEAEARSGADRRIEAEPVPAPPAPKPHPAPEQAMKPETVLPVGMAQVDRAAAPSGAAALTSDERLLRLQEALHARARSLAAKGQSVSTAPSVQASLSKPQLSPPSPEPKSVFFDFQSGVKTTVLMDETSVEEPFDPASMKGLASARPVQTPGQNRP
jgi:hypothetical protein